jgi:hypothetical protein
MTRPAPLNVSETQTLDSGGQHNMNDNRKTRSPEDPEDPNRRTFLQGTAVTLGGAAIAGSLLSVIAEASHLHSGKLSPGSKTHVEGALQRKLTKWETTSGLDGDEAFGQIELSNSSGETDTLHFYGRWTRHGDNYTVFHRFAPTKFSLGHIGILSGWKGPVTGDRRVDKITVALFGDDGSVARFPEREIRVRLANPYEGASPQDAFDAFQKDKAAGKFNR